MRQWKIGILDFYRTEPETKSQRHLVVCEWNGVLGSTFFHTLREWFDNWWSPNILGTNFGNKVKNTHVRAYCVVTFKVHTTYLLRFVDMVSTYIGRKTIDHYPDEFSPHQCTQKMIYEWFCEKIALCLMKKNFCPLSEALTRNLLYFPQSRIFLIEAQRFYHSIANMKFSEIKHYYWDKAWESWAKSAHKWASFCDDYH